MYVGGDAYIAPWGTNEFALDFHKNGLYRRVDVGIDPYAGPKNYRNPVGADDPVRPWEVSNSPEISVKKRIFPQAGRVARTYNLTGVI